MNKFKPENYSAKSHKFTTNFIKSESRRKYSLVFMIHRRQKNHINRFEPEARGSVCYNINTLENVASNWEISPSFRVNVKISYKSRPHRAEVTFLPDFIWVGRCSKQPRPAQTDGSLLQIRKPPNAFSPSQREQICCVQACFFTINMKVWNIFWFAFSKLLRLQPQNGINWFVPLSKLLNKSFNDIQIHQKKLCNIQS